MERQRTGINKLLVWLIIVTTSGISNVDAGNPFSSGIIAEILLIPPRAPSKNMSFIDDIFADYDKRLWPTYGTDEPTLVEVELWVQSFGPLDSSSMDYPVNLYLREYWYDPRLSLLRHGVNETFVINGGDMASLLWKPDLTFVNMKAARIQEITVPTSLVKIFPDGRVLYSVRLNLRLSCALDFQLYPFDIQQCHIIIRSYAHTVNEIDLAWKEDSPVTLDYPLKLSEFQLVDDYNSTYNKELPTGNFTVLQYTFVLQRLRGYHLIYVYLPSALIVCASWVCLWLKVEIPQARVALGAVTLLTLVSLASSVRTTIPRVAYIKAIDVWYATCIMFVFAVLSVATCTHYLVRVRLRPLCVRRVDHWVVDVYQRLVYGRRTDPFLLTMDKENKLEQHRNVKMSQAFERVARYMFPVCFGFFNVVYWSFYVERSYYRGR
ncbi:glycine receptor subunit alpha-3-like [Amblyomma americanum]